MRTMTESPLALAKAALKVAEASLPAYSGPYSPKVYTQHQLFALLVLREFLNTTRRRTVAIVQEWSELQQVLGLKKVPDQSTLCCAKKRLLKKGLSTPFSASPLTTPVTSD